MDARQRAVLWGGILLIAAMGVFPPWVVSDLDEPSVKHFRYAWLFLPPEGSTAHLDIPRLVVQWAIVAVLTAGCCFVGLPFGPATARRLALLALKTVIIAFFFTVFLAEQSQSVKAALQPYGYDMWLEIGLTLLVVGVTGWGLVAAWKALKRSLEKSS